MKKAFLAAAVLLSVIAAKANVDSMLQRSVKMMVVEKTCNGAVSTPTDSDYVLNSGGKLVVVNRVETTETTFSNMLLLLGKPMNSMVASSSSSSSGFGGSKSENSISFTVEAEARRVVKRAVGTEELLEDTGVQNLNPTNDMSKTLKIAQSSKTEGLTITIKNTEFCPAKDATEGVLVLKVMALAEAAK